MSAIGCQLAQRGAAQRGAAQRAEATVTSSAPGHEPLVLDGASLDVPLHLLGAGTEDRGKGETAERDERADEEHAVVGTLDGLGRLAVRGWSNGADLGEQEG